MVGRRLTARFMEGGELGVVGMMAGPSSVKDGYIVIEHFGNTYNVQVSCARVCRGVVEAYIG